MRKAAFLAVFTLGAALAAQSQLTTLIQSNNGGGLNGGVYFDLTAHVGMQITRIDCNLNEGLGHNGTINVYMIPSGSWSPNATNQAAWTLVGTGPITSAGFNLPSACTLTTPIALNPGTYAVALHHVNCSAAYTDGNGINQTYANNDLALALGGASNTCFVGPLFQPRVWNGSIHYTVAPGFAVVNKVGTGCYDDAATFYEYFPFGVGTFDLNPTAPATSRSIQMIPANGGYVVTPGVSNWHTPTSPDLALGDEFESVQSLPFTLPYPGGTTTSITMQANGVIWLNSSGNGNTFNIDVADLLARPARLCPLWIDLDGLTTPGSSFHFDSDPANGVVYCTWLGVGEWNTPGTANTFQCAIYSSGVVEYRWQQCAVVGYYGIVGWSPGGNARNPGGTDLSVAPPFATLADSVPLTMTTTGRPRIGQPITLNVHDIPATATAVVTVVGLTGVPGFDLGVIGAPGCFQYAALDVMSFLPPSGPTVSQVQGVPNIPSLAGYTAYVQGAALVPGVNSFGLLTTNGLALTLNMQ